MTKEIFLYRPKNYPGPVALDAIPSKECKGYHENSCVQVNIDGKSFVKKISEIQKDKTP